MRACILFLLAASVLVLPASADTRADGTGRHDVRPVEGGFFRTDRVTGVSSFCRPSAGAWSCTLVPDDLDAFQEEISRLNRRIEMLEETRNEMRQRIEILEGEEQQAIETEDAPATPPRDRNDQAMGAVERMVRGFLAFVAEIGSYFTK